MHTAPSSDALTVRLERTIAAPPERVFRAWTDPAYIAKWFGPGPDFPVLEVAMDPREGGAYRFVVADPTGKQHTVKGIYRRIDPPKTLSFTWAWESPGWVGRESRVTVELAPTDDGGTHLTLTHTELLDADAVRNHGEGWNGGLDQLKALVESER